MTSTSLRARRRRRFIAALEALENHIALGALLGGPYDLTAGGAAHKGAEPRPAAQVGAAAADFIVNSVGDAKAANPAVSAATGNMIKLDNGMMVPEVTLRSAIEAANADNKALETIAFQIPNLAKVNGAWTITPAKALDTVTRPTVIDATTQMVIAQSATPVVVLSGSMLGNNKADGLNITAGGSTVKGLVVSSFNQNGIDLSGKGGDLITGDFIGIDVTGTIGAGNSSNGILINNVPNNTVGGTAAGTRNVISGNPGKDFDNLGRGGGILLVGVGAQPNANKNVVLGNFIGTDKNGTADIANRNGVVIRRGDNNTIGGADVLARNVISGNDSGSGVVIGDGATGNKVQGNFIGVDATGKTALRNTFIGVLIDASTNNLVGGSTATPGTAPGNVISGNGVSGILIRDGSMGNKVQGNFVGIGSDGSELGNSTGVTVLDSPKNTIGGTAAERNVISGNRNSGVVIQDVPSQDNVVASNYIGTDQNGALPLANGADGVLILNASNNTIGAGNIISGNEASGVHIHGTDVETPARLPTWSKETASAPTSRETISSRTRSTA